MRRFARYTWIVVAFNLAVILWGAYVRATGSGAGCGEHWPLCNGEVLPRSPALATTIEFTHRITSGLAVILVAVLVAWAFRTMPRGHQARRFAVLAAVFTLTEGLIGAALVLLGHTAQNQSNARGISLSVHLINTLILLAMLALTAWTARDREPGTEEQRGPLKWAWAIAAFGLLLIGVTGAIAALGDTLFASSSLAEGIRHDFSSSAHLFVRLRILHPILASVFGMFLLLVASQAALSQGRPSIQRLGWSLALLTIAQIGLGVANLLLFAPVWMQLVHLFSADLLWINFVLLGYEILAARVPALSSAGETYGVSSPAAP
jgi:heme A synthase